MHTLSDDDWRAVRRALEIAAIQYTLDAVTMSDASMPLHADRFMRQAEEARKLLSKIEEME